MGLALEVIAALRTAWAYRRGIALGVLLVLLAHYYALAVSRGGRIDELQAQINLRDQLSSFYQDRANVADKELADFRAASRKARKTITGTQAQDQEHIASLVRAAIDAGADRVR